jgi:hypothetical protein
LLNLASFKALWAHGRNAVFSHCSVTIAIHGQLQVVLISIMNCYWACDAWERLACSLCLQSHSHSPSVEKAIRHSQYGAFNKTLPHKTPTIQFDTQAWTRKVQKYFLMLQTLRQKTIRQRHMVSHNFWYSWSYKSISINFIIPR